MTGHGEIIHINHKLVSKFKDNHVIFIPNFRCFWILKNLKSKFKA